MIKIDSINSEKDLRSYLSFMIKMTGLGFHPDDPIDGYVDNYGHCLFLSDEVPVLERLKKESFDYCSANNMDVYEVSMEVAKEQFGDFFGGF